MDEDVKAILVVEKEVASRRLIFPKFLNGHRQQLRRTQGPRHQDER